MIATITPWRCRDREDRDSGRREAGRPSRWVAPRCSRRRLDDHTLGEQERIGPQRREVQHDRRAAAPMIVKTYGPVSGGIPIASPTSSPGPVRFGPSTAPIVVAHTTIDRSRPREASVGEVGRGEARLQVGRLPAADEQECREQQRERAHRHREHHEDHAHQSDRHAGRERQATPATAARGARAGWRSAPCRT